MALLIFGLLSDVLWELLDVFFLILTPMPSWVSQHAWGFFIALALLLPVLSAISHVLQYRQRAREQAGHIREQKETKNFFVEELDRQRDALVKEMRTIVTKPETPEQKVQEFEQFSTAFDGAKVLAAYSQRRARGRVARFPWLLASKEDKPKGNGN